jgi:hypothetical protein
MITLLLSMLLAKGSPEFCSGYRQGFVAAYCAGHQFCTSAPVPACPDEHGSFQDGYSAGYSAGERAHPSHDR